MTCPFIVSEVVHHAYEAYDYLQRIRLWNLPDTLNPLITQLHGRFVKTAAQELHTIHAKVTLGWFESDIDFTTFDKI